MAEKTILILESNPWQDLSLNQEIRDLVGVIERARNADAFKIEQGLAVRRSDLQELMLKHEPQIVHFCGHGSGEEGLVLQDAAQQPVAVATEALSRLFRLCKNHVDCVVLNACYSEVQAEAIVEHVDYAIGMQQAIRDDAAQHFAQGFYRALGYGKSVEVAYEWGCNAIQLMLASEAEVRMRDSAVPQRRKISRVAEVEGQKPLPEHLKPRLFKRVALGEVKLAEMEHPSGTELEDLGQALEQEDALEQYRGKVREFLEDRKLSALETIRLERLRKDLGLAQSDVNQVIDEEMGPILKTRDDYEAMLLELIELGHYPFDEETSGELDSARQELGLIAQEAEDIARPIVVAAEVNYQKQLLREKKQAEEKYQKQEEYKKSRYRQELERALAAGYPPDDFVLEGLRHFQQSLGLTDEVVAQIEQPIFSRLEEQQQNHLRQQAEKRHQEEKKRREDHQHRQAKDHSHRDAKRRKWQVFTFETATLKTKSTADTGSTMAQILASFWTGFSGQEPEIQIVNSKWNSQADYFIEYLGHCISLDLGHDISLEMVRIPGGEFLMGATEDEAAALESEYPQHWVKVPEFCIGKFAVTQMQYQRLIGKNPSHFAGDRRPVENVSWNDAQNFCHKLSALVGWEYRLPSEAEWEYACRAGTTTPFSLGDMLTPDVANYDVNQTYYGNEIKGKPRGQTLEVGSFLSNGFGLYDMHDNVCEWCADRWHSNYSGAPNDGSAWNATLNSSENSSELYVRRGGSWNSISSDCRSAYRYRSKPGSYGKFIGFRVACAVPNL